MHLDWGAPTLNTSTHNVHNLEGEVGPLASLVLWHYDEQPAEENVHKAITSQQSQPQLKPRVPYAPRPFFGENLCMR